MAAVCLARWYAGKCDQRCDDTARQGAACQGSTEPGTYDPKKRDAAV